MEETGRKRSPTRYKEPKPADYELGMWLDSRSLQELARHIEERGEHRKAAKDDLSDKLEKLWYHVKFRALKRGETEAQASAMADIVVGKTWKERLAMALSGNLDDLYQTRTDTDFDRIAELLHWALKKRRSR